MDITEIYSRLKSEQGDRHAFPRPNYAILAAFEAVGSKGKASDPITTIEIEAMTGVSMQRLSTALASLAGLLAIYGADYRLHRVNLSEGNCPRYGYFIAPANQT
jgi:hypothetical protein